MTGPRTVQERGTAVDVGLARWVRDAGCGVRPDLPWTVDGHLLRVPQVRAMERVCRGCPVRNHCAAYAVEGTVTGGFWAGHDRDVLAHRRLNIAGVPVQPALPGFGGTA